MEATLENVCSEYGFVAAQYIEREFCTLKIRYQLDEIQVHDEGCW